MRAMVIGLWVITRKRVPGLLGDVANEIAEALDIGIVERRVDLVEHADGRGVGQEHREDQRGRGQGLLAAGEQRQCLRPLARRIGDDLEPGLERILGFDELQLGRAAAEQGLEKALEMRVHRGEGGRQPLGAFAVQAR